MQKKKKKKKSPTEGGGRGLSQKILRTGEEEEDRKSVAPGALALKDVLAVSSNMVVLMLTYSPSVYNQSCQQPFWPASSSWLDNNNVSSSSSSGHQPYSAQPFVYSGYDVFRCGVVLLVTCGLVLGNLILALAVNSKYSAGILQFQTRCLLTSIATNQLASGLLVTVWDIYPSLTGCWPYGVLLCQIQAVLLGSLSQHGSILWILVALDRYLFALRRRRYLALASSKLCVWVVGITWVLSFAYYTSIVLPYSAFDYSNDGSAGCEPVPQSGVLMLVSTCLLYFPTTMILLYVYGTVFHSHQSSQRRRSAPISSSTGRTPQKAQFHIGGEEVGGCSHHHRSFNSQDCFNVKVEESVTRSMATMSLAYVINSTPWIIKQIIVACLGNEVAPWLDFVITWSWFSLGVWNPLLCWLLCPPIRDGVRHVLSKACVCCYSNNYSSSQSTRRSSTWMSEISTVNGVLPTTMTPCEVHRHRHPMRGSTASIAIRDEEPMVVPPPPPPPASSSAAGRFSPIEQGERIWGEILERSLSSGSLHRLQRIGQQIGADGCHDDDRRRNGKLPGNNWAVE